MDECHNEFNLDGLKANSINEVVCLAMFGR